MVAAVACGEIECLPVWHREGVAVVKLSAVDGNALRLAPFVGKQCLAVDGACTARLEVGEHTLVAELVLKNKAPGRFLVAQLPHIRGQRKAFPDVIDIDDDAVCNHHAADGIVCPFAVVNLGLHFFVRDILLCRATFLRLKRKGECQGNEKYDGCQGIEIWCFVWHVGLCCVIPVLVSDHKNTNFPCNGKIFY